MRIKILPKFLFLCTVLLSISFSSASSHNNWSDASAMIEADEAMINLYLNENDENLSNTPVYADLAVDNCPGGMEGDGTEASPCLITDWNDLDAVRLEPGLAYRLGNDLTTLTDGYSYYNVIDENNEGWEPIGGGTSSGFTGAFDGSNRTISGLQFTYGDNNLLGYQLLDIGLFSIIGEGGIVKDLNFTDVDLEATWVSYAGRTGVLAGTVRGDVTNVQIQSGTIRSTRGNLGGLAGRISGGTVSNSESHINLTENEEEVIGGAFGGLVGSIGAGEINSSSSTGNVTTYTVNGGGLVGSQFGNSGITQSFATGNVTGSNNQGGLVGLMNGFSRTSSIESSYATGDVNGTQNVGGLVGQGQSSEIIDSFAEGRVEGTQYVGGLIGNHTGTATSVSRSFSTGEVIGGFSDTDDLVRIGGLIGNNGGSVTESYALGNVVAGSSNRVGGLIGLSAGTIKNSYAIGNVTGNTDVGGLVGTNGGGVENSFSVGAISGNTDAGSDVGGLVGANSSFLATDGTVTDAYWDRETSAISSSAGGTGLTSEEMKGGAAVNNLSGFDFTHTWNVTNEGSDGSITVSYPYLIENEQEPNPGLETIVRFAAGEGTDTSPFQIENWEQLSNIRQDPGKYFLLNNDLNNTTPDYDEFASSTANDNTGWEPISLFTGNLNGNGNTIGDLIINRVSEDNIGLFGRADGGTIENLTFESVEIKGGEFVAVVVGQANGSAVTIDNVHIRSGSAEGGRKVAGFIGQVDQEGESESVIRNASNAADITSTGSEAGGFFGGIEAHTDRITIEDSFNAGDVSVTGWSVGGLVGFGANIHILRSSSTATITSNTNGGSRAGGLAGLLTNNSLIQKSFAAGTVKKFDGEYAGGLVGVIGRNNTYNVTIRDSYSNAEVIANGVSSVGGLIGEVFAQSASEINISESYATGPVTSDGTNVGGLIGLIANAGSAEVTNSYWDQDLTGLTTSDGGSGLTTEAMKGSSAHDNMVDFEFTTTWDVFDGVIEESQSISYPFLRNNTQDPLPGLEVGLYAGGDGTVENPFEIKTWKHLDNVRQNLGSHFKLMADLNKNTLSYEELAGETANGNAGWEPIGDNDNRFRGSFDGNGTVYEISDLTIRREEAGQVGLFGSIDEAKLKSIILTNADIIGGWQVGGLVGVIRNYSTITESSVLGKVTGQWNQVGGLIGLADGNNNNDAILITDSYSIADVDGDFEVGGLAGEIFNTTISNSYATGNVSNSGDLTGGLVGENAGAITTSFAIGDVTSSANSAGGLVGENSGTITKSFATGNVEGLNKVGGFVGENSDSAPIEDSYATGGALGATTTGGFVGNNAGEIARAYSAGAVSLISGDEALGGFAGNNFIEFGASISDSFWDIQTSGQESSDGGTGLTTEEMKGSAAKDNMSSLGGLNFDTTWDVVDSVVDGSLTVSYPYLIENKQEPEPGLEAKGSLFAGGAGTDESPYEITNWEELKNINLAPDAAFILINDLDSATPGYSEYASATANDEAGWEPIGEFTGVFDGNNMSIAGLVINRADENDIGLFTSIGLDGSVFDLTLSDFEVIAAQRAAGLTGTVRGSVKNVSVSGTVIGNRNDAGGLAARLNGGTIVNSSAEVTVTQSGTGTGNFGGLVGQLYSDGQITGSSSSGTLQTSGVNGGGLVGLTDGGSVENSSSSVNVEGNSYQGGLIGYVSATVINGSTATGAVSGVSHIGGLIGESWGGVIDDSYATGNATSTGNYVGGFAGNSIGETNISKSFATGSVSGAGYVGGFVGNIASQSIVGTSHAIGEVTGSGNNIGGFAGVGDGIISKSYARGAVSGTGSPSNYVGGLAGYANGNILTSYATGNVTGTGQVGGLVGATYADEISSSFSSGSVMADGDLAGGLIGESGAKIVKNSYAVGDVTGADKTGGLIGVNYGSIEKNYAAGLVKGDTNTGGLIGSNEGGSIDTSFWDVDTSGQPNSSGGTGIASSLMKNIATFTTELGADSWDFDNAWQIEEAGVISYPYLQTFEYDDLFAEPEVNPVPGLEIIGFVWTGDEDTEGDNDGNWDGNTPPPGADIYIPNLGTDGNYPVFGGQLQLGSIIMGENAMLYINPQGSLELSGDVSGPGEIIVESGGLFNNQGGSSPQLRIKRELTGFSAEDPRGGEGWRYVSSPIGGISLSGLLEDIWTQGVVGSDFPGTAPGTFDDVTPNVFYWDISTSGTDRTEWIPADLTEDVEPGKGYLVYVFGSDHGETPVGENLEIELTGKEFSGFTVSTNNNTGTDGWTLLGNPFATSISFNELRQDGNRLIRDVVYVWTPFTNDGEGGNDEENPDAGSWRAWSADGGLGDLTNGLIAPFQAFFVENDENSSNVSLSFTNNLKRSQIPSYLFKQSESQDDYLRLELSGQGVSNSTWLGFTSEGDAESRTAGDAWQLEPMSPEYAVLATGKADGLFDIGNFPIGSENLDIPLHTQVSRSGTFSLQVTDFSVGGMDLYLNDLHTGQSVRLEEGMSYEFRINQADKEAPVNPLELVNRGMKKEIGDAHRFTINKKSLSGDSADELPGAVALDQNYPNPFNPTTQISYELPESRDVQLTVYDLTGRQVAALVSGRMEGGLHTVTFDGSSLSSGVYIYRLQTGGQLLTRKLTLIK